MRIAFLASSLVLGLLSCGAATDRIELPSGGSLRFAAKSGKTQFDVSSAGGASHRLLVERDSTVSPKAAPSAVKIIGQVNPSVLILVDSYPSIPGGMSMCQAGEERFLRVLSIATKPAQETFRLKLESCRENIELASPGLEWRAESSTLAIKWLFGPGTKGKPEERTLKIAADGKVQ
jgi:hypothetical protein